MSMIEPTPKRNECPVAWPETVPAADRKLLAEAWAGREMAHAPISHYRVGAALRVADGCVVRGCNVENILLGLSPCAEMVAVFTAVCGGSRAFETVAVVTDSSPPAAPCGSCRQLLFSWGVKRVVLGNLAGEVREFSMAELMPHAFDLEGPV